MTDEQKLKQIRERWTRTSFPEQIFTSHAKQDIDFLLSLVDSQVAAKASGNALTIARDLVCNWRDEWRIPTPEPGLPLDSQSDLIARIAALVTDLEIIIATASDEDPRSALSKLHKIQHDAATPMRSACIEKAKEMADDWLKQAIAERDVERSDKLRMSYNVAQTIIEALKAVGEQPCTTKSN